MCLLLSPRPDEGCLPYNKPSFPSPGGHSSSGTASSKGSTGPRKNEGPRQPHQWTVTEHADFLGTNGQGQYSGELCKCTDFYWLEHVRLRGCCCCCFYDGVNIPQPNDQLTTAILNSVGHSKDQIVYYCCFKLTTEKILN